MNIKLQLDGLSRVKTMLGDDVARRIVYQTLNKLTATTVAEIKRQIRTEYNIKAKDIASGLRWHKSNQYNLYTTIKMSGKRLPLSQFSARQTKQVYQ